MNKVFLITLLFLLAGCAEQKQETAKTEAKLDPYQNNAFAGYWDNGVAELTSYDLQQYRYGESRNGEAVLIFVTEDFSAKKQVKLDDPQNAGDDAVHILKLNFTKKFITGIYPYSMMTSVFFPLNGDDTPVKITTSSQEWCGHTFTQLNKTQKGYDAHLYSYFESEGDQNISIDKVVLEDGLWNMIRIAPEQLPQGDVLMLPGTMFQRLSHKQLKAVTAQCTLTTYSGADSNFAGNNVMEYKVVMPDYNRTLNIYYQSEFPYRIMGWTETHPGIGNGEPLTTKATLRRQIMLDYWKHHDVADSNWRDSLMVNY